MTTGKAPTETTAPRTVTESLEHVERPPGRFAAALAVLSGQAVVPRQIHAEWLEYQLIFNDLLQRWSAQLARGARAEKKRLKALAKSSTEQIELLGPPAPSPASMSREDHKAGLRSRLLHRRGSPQQSLASSLRSRSNGETLPSDLELEPLEEAP